MRLAKAWIIADKDFRLFMKKKGVLYSMIVPSVLVSIIVPLLMHFDGSLFGTTPIPSLLNNTLFFFVIQATTMPMILAAYSIVGEKSEKSLEPLLAAPVTDGEILFGKSLAALLPAIIATWATASIFMVLGDIVTYGKLGYLYFPNVSAAVILLIVIPLVSLFSIEVNIIISSRANDVRTAQQMGAFAYLPIAAIFGAGLFHIFVLNVPTLLVISVIILAVDAILYFISTNTFQREEILTKWK